MMEAYFDLHCTLVLLLILCSYGESEDAKRLVLHSEIDIAQEVAKINSKIENLTKSLAEKDKEIETLMKTLADFQTCTLYNYIYTNSGSTYVRWGRTTCPHNDTELVYTGYMATSAHTTTGGGTNFLCLTNDPQWSQYDESIKSDTTITGVEYEFYAFRADGASKFFGYNVFNDDAVCAVCHSPRSATLMIPGRTECYSGWIKEYSGYLVSEYDTAAHASDFICLDDKPETLVGGKADQNGGLLYFVEAYCGRNLECPPYIEGRELTCVVCTK